MQCRSLVTTVSSVADLNPDLNPHFLTLGSGIRDGVKKLGFGSGMDNPDHISERLKRKFGVKILKFFDVAPGSATLAVSTVALGFDSPPRPSLAAKKLIFPEAGGKYRSSAEHPAVDQL